MDTNYLLMRHNSLSNCLSCCRSVAWALKLHTMCSVLAPPPLLKWLMSRIVSRNIYWPFLKKITPPSLPLIPLVFIIFSSEKFASWCFQKLFIFHVFAQQFVSKLNVAPIQIFSSHPCVDYIFSPELGCDVVDYTMECMKKWKRLENIFTRIDLTNYSLRYAFLWDPKENLNNWILTNFHPVSSRRQQI